MVEEHGKFRVSSIHVGTLVVLIMDDVLTVGGSIPFNPLFLDLMTHERLSRVFVTVPFSHRQQLPIVWS